MLGGNSNSMLPVFLDDHFPYQTNASNRLQLFGSLPPGCSVDPVNYFGNEHITPIRRPNKRGRETEDIPRQQKLQMSLNYKNVADCSASIPNPHLVSTGLRLSYDDDEPKSSVTSGSGSRTVVSSIISSLSDNVRIELDRQKEEFERYIKIQKENLAKGVRDMKQKHTASFLVSIEKGAMKKLHEKDLEKEIINRKNSELLENIKKVVMEAQNWHYRAKYNESVVYALKNNLQQAISQGPADQGKEGFGDSEVDDASSYFHTNHNASVQHRAERNVRCFKEHIICRACNVKEVSVLLIPCRHLCLCKGCDMFTSVCPVCHFLKTTSVQVSFS